MRHSFHAEGKRLSSCAMLLSHCHCLLQETQHTLETGSQHITGGKIPQTAGLIVPANVLWYIHAYIRLFSQELLEQSKQKETLQCHSRRNHCKNALPTKSSESIIYRRCDGMEIRLISVLILFTSSLGHPWVS